MDQACPHGRRRCATVERLYPDVRRRVVPSLIGPVVADHLLSCSRAELADLPAVPVHTVAETPSTWPNDRRQGSIRLISKCRYAGRYMSSKASAPPCGWFVRCIELTFGLGRTFDDWRHLGYIAQGMSNTAVAE